MVSFTPFTVRLVKFQELMYEPRLLDCQQKVPTPSWVKGAVIVAVTGLHVEPLVGVAVTASGVRVRVGVFVIPAVGVRVGVLVIPAVGVRVGVVVIAGGVVGVAVRVGVFEGPAVGVLVTVAVGPLVGSLPAARIPRT